MGALVQRKVHEDALGRGRRQSGVWLFGYLLPPPYGWLAVSLLFITMVTSVLADGWRSDRGYRARVKQDAAESDYGRFWRQ